MKLKMLVVLIGILLLSSCDQIVDSPSGETPLSMPASTPTPSVSIKPIATPDPSVSRTLPTPPAAIPSAQESTEIVAPTDIWYFYNQLDTSQKAAYLGLYDSLTAYIHDNTDIEPFSYKLDNTGSTVNGQDIVAFMCYDNPALTSYFASYIAASEDNGSIVFRDFGTSDLRVLGDIPDIRQQIRELEAAADDFLSDIDPALSDYEKYLAIATKLSVETAYDDGFNSAEQLIKDFLLDISVYGGLVNRLCACQGFAKTYQYLCQRAGLFCMFLDGKTAEAEHEWNIIKLDDGYYHVDTTWMRTDGNRYFCLTDAQISLDHTLNSQYHPACEGTKYAYDSGKIPD